jgi:eukaryotic-like serine/threonine-protein kinase
VIQHSNPKDPQPTSRPLLSDSGSSGRVSLPERRSSSRGDLHRFGAYVVVEKIATGGMAEIYKAYHERRPGDLVALKRIRPDCDEDVEFRRMMMDEAKIASVLDHACIAKVLGVEQDGESLGLILEHVDGLDLGRIKKIAKDHNHQFSLEVCIHVVREVLEGLDFAHNAKDVHGEYLNVVHRDISPGNVMIDVQGRVKIVDFGIARASNRLAKTEAGNVKGKFRYMAPEQIKGLAVGPFTDVYSTAVLLWELLSGKRIYDDVSVGQLMIRVANAEMPKLGDARPNLPPALNAVFAKATALDPADRYASARAFADALDRVLFEYDAERCRKELRELVRSARASERQRGLERAVVRARFAATNDLDGLEDALLRALEQPDRVERVDIEWEKVKSAEAPTPPTPATPVPHDIGEPPTHPMARVLPGDLAGGAVA